LIICLHNCDVRSGKAVPAGKRKNNIWGTFIQEEELNTDLLGVGVGRYATGQPVLGIRDI
jgi:hypothetical protein